MSSLTWILQGRILQLLGLFEDFLKEKLYEMYRFPEINHRKSLEFKV